MKQMATGAKARLAVGLVGLAALFAIACRGAEPFSLGLDGGILITQGSGGFPAGTGGEIIIVTGTGGVPGSGGAPGTVGSGGAPGAIDAGTVVDVTAVDMASVVDAAAADLRRDATAARDLTAEGPLTLFNCYALQSYVLNARYAAGAKVFSLRDLRVYQCKELPYSPWCSQGAYEPGGPLGYWTEAWTPLGYCE